MEKAGSVEIKVTRAYQIPKEVNCGGCDQKDGDVFCKAFRKVIHLDARYKNRVPVPECIKARKVAGRKKARKK